MTNNEISASSNLFHTLKYNHFPMSILELCFRPHTEAYPHTLWSVSCSYLVSVSQQAIHHVLQHVWPWLIIQPSLAINHLLSACCLHGKRPSDFTTKQDVHFGTQTSAHTRAGRWKHIFACPVKSMSEMKVEKMRIERVAAVWMLFRLFEGSDVEPLVSPAQFWCRFYNVKVYLSPPQKGSIFCLTGAKSVFVFGRFSKTMSQNDCTCKVWKPDKEVKLEGF